MEFIRPALIFTSLACTMLAGAFIYVWLAYTRRRYALLWGLSWLVAVPHLACTWILLDSPNLRAFLIADQVLLVANAFFMVCGCLDFVYRRIPVRAVLLIALPFLAWGIFAPLTSISFANVQAPNAFLLGGSYLVTASNFLRLRRERRTRGALAIAILFAVGGLHEFDYPLFGNQPWAAPFGYTLASVIATLIALSLLILILEEARADVEQERSRLRGVLDALPVGVVVFGPDGAAALDNPAAREMLGQPRSADPTSLPALSNRLHAAGGSVSPASADESPMARSLRTGEPSAPQEFALSRPAAASRAVLVNAAPMRDAKSQLLGVVTVLQDVEELKEAERRMVRSQRLEALGTLAAGVAHNFNNALSLILGHAELARQAEEDPAVRARLDSIRQVAADSVGIVSRIQDLARSRPLESAGDALADLGGVARDVIELARPRWQEEAASQGMTYTVETRIDEGIEVKAQASELREAVLNLVINALDAMPSGGQILFSVAAEGHEAVLRVTDDGEGMSPEVQERVFDPFYSTKGTRGTGLGLSSVLGIVERFDGRILVESTLGVGTTFTLRFPLVGAAPRAATFGPRSLSTPRHVLVVDDDTMLRELTVDMLRQEGHSATPASTGEEALRMIESSEFDLLLTDLVMPGMTGWDVIDGAARIRPGLPVVLMTGLGQIVAPEECAAKGVMAVLSKPFTLDEIAAAVASATAPSRPAETEIARVA